ncbi:putative N-terminal cleavage protein [Magnetofaba australis IT-1]|uniref:Putative N-terminal cleavage protein n=2 Tax=Magnetofaba TaxID=1472292 RepID=A0A1Y2K0X2_9PROT|nr:putative N-terminal cleavage protein [Magnetofaba australis IT-1]
MEMVIAIAILGLVGVAVAPLFNTLARGYMLSEQMDNALREGYIAMQRISLELRDAERNPAVMDISHADELTIGYNGSVFRYYLDGSQLMVDRDGSTGVLADGVENLQFVYDTADPATVSNIQFSMEIVNGDVRFTLRNTIYPHFT